MFVEIFHILWVTNEPDRIYMDAMQQWLTKKSLHVRWINYWWWNIRVIIMIISNLELVFKNFFFLSENSQDIPYTHIHTCWSNRELVEDINGWQFITVFSICWNNFRKRLKNPFSSLIRKAPWDYGSLAQSGMLLNNSKKRFREILSYFRLYV